MSNFIPVSLLNASNVKFLKKYVEEQNVGLLNPLM